MIDCWWSIVNPIKIQNIAEKTRRQPGLRMKYLYQSVLKWRKEKETFVIQNTLLTHVIHKSWDLFPYCIDWFICSFSDSLQIQILFFSYFTYDKLYTQLIEHFLSSICDISFKRASLRHLISSYARKRSLIWTLQTAMWQLFFKMKNILIS